MFLSTQLCAILNGIGITLSITIASLALGFMCACCITYWQLATSSALGKSILLYCKTIKGSPLLLQLFFVYYGLGSLPGVQHSIWWNILKHPMACAILTLSNNSMAFISNLLLGACKKIPSQQIISAENLGLSKLQIYIKIQLPLALKKILPYYHNEILMLLKSSSLASTITCLDISGVTAQIVSQNFQNIKWYCILAGIYIALSGLLMLIFKLSQHTLSILKSTRLHHPS